MTELRFALAGKIVSKPDQAQRILRDAIVSNKQYLIPQARSVLRQLNAAALRTA